MANGRTLSTCIIMYVKLSLLGPGVCSKYILRRTYGRSNVRMSAQSASLTPFNSVGTLQKSSATHPNRNRAVNNRSWSDPLEAAVGFPCDKMVAAGEWLHASLVLNVGYAKNAYVCRQHVTGRDEAHTCYVQSRARH